MYDQNLKNRVFDKLNSALKIYEKLIYTKVGELQHTQAFFTREHLREVPSDGFAPIAPGASWGGEWQNMWLQGDFTVPAQLGGRDLYVVSGCGGTEQLFFLNGVPKGIVNSKNRDFIGGSHASLYLGKAEAGQTLRMAFECYAGHYDPNTDPYDDYFRPDPTQGFDHTFNGVDICTRNEEIFTLIFDIRELLNAARRLPEDRFIVSRARNALLKINEVLPLFPKDASDEKVAAGVRAALSISRPFFSVRLHPEPSQPVPALFPPSRTVRRARIIRRVSGAGQGRPGVLRTFAGKKAPIFCGIDLKVGRKALDYCDMVFSFCD